MIWLSIKFGQYVKENSTAFLWNVLSKHLAFQESLLLINGLSFLFRLFMVLGFQYWHWYPKFSELEKKKIVENGVEGQDSFAIDCILETALAF